MGNKVTPFLMFNDQLEAAIQFYTATFPGSKVLNAARAGKGAREERRRKNSAADDGRSAPRRTTSRATRSSACASGARAALPHHHRARFRVIEPLHVTPNLRLVATATDSSAR